MSSKRYDGVGKSLTSSSDALNWDFRTQVICMYQHNATNLGEEIFSEFKNELTQQFEKKPWYSKASKNKAVYQPADNFQSFMELENAKIIEKLENANSLVEMQAIVDAYGARLRTFVQHSLKDLDRLPNPKSFHATSIPVVTTGNIFATRLDSAATISRLEGEVKELHKLANNLLNKVENLVSDNAALQEKLRDLERKAYQQRSYEEEEKRQQREREKERERELKRQREEDRARQEAEERLREEKIRQEKQKQIQYQNLSRQFTVYFDKKTCAMNTKSIDVLFNAVRDHLSQYGLVPKMEVVDALPAELSPQSSLVVSFMYYPPARFLPAIVAHANTVVEAIGAANWCGVLLERVDNPTQIRQFEELQKQATIWTARWNNDSDPTEADIVPDNLMYLRDEIVKLVGQKIIGATNNKNLQIEYY